MPVLQTPPDSPSLLATDRRHVWHPFTQMQEYGEVPGLAIASGQGGWLTDTEGRTYLDGNASIWTNVHGHNDPDLNAALIRQLDRVAHSTMLGLTHPTGTELAAELAALAPPGLSRVFFTDNGAGAVEVALKLSFQYWQLRGRPEKRGAIGMAEGYHGDTFGAMAVGDSGFFHDRFRSWCFPTDHFPAPHCRELAGRVRAADSAASLAGLRQLLEEKAAQTACLILEPSVQGAAGMRQQPPGFVAAVAALCREFEVHLILDEVFVAFGRLGSMLVCSAEGVVPDFLCLAKGLTAGYLPLAATLVQEEIYAAFWAPMRAGGPFSTGTHSPVIRWPRRWRWKISASSGLSWPTASCATGSPASAKGWSPPSPATPACAKSASAVWRRRWNWRRDPWNAASDSRSACEPASTVCCCARWATASCWCRRFA